MPDDIGDEERSFYIDIDDNTDTDNSTIERVLKISRCIWSEKFGILISELIDESFCSTINELFFIDRLRLDVVIVEN